MVYYTDKGAHIENNAGGTEPAFVASRRLLSMAGIRVSYQISLRTLRSHLFRNRCFESPHQIGSKVSSYVIKTGFVRIVHEEKLKKDFLKTHGIYAILSQTTPDCPNEYNQRCAVSHTISQLTKCGVSGYMVRQVWQHVPIDKTLILEFM